jgi:CRISPR-associated protein Csx14
VNVDCVVLLTTKDTYAQDTANLISEHLPDYYGGAVAVYDVRILDRFYDVDSDEAAAEFMEQTCDALRSYRKMGWEVYACIAGGRKAMSALLALAVQFYGARRLFHVLVEDPVLEEEGHILKLKNKSREEQKQALHPPVDQIKLVNLPFIGLFPLLGNIIAGLKGEAVPSEVKILLEQNGLVTPAGPTDLGRMVLRVLESVEALPEPRAGKCEIQLAHKEPKEADETKKWAERLANRFSFVERIDDIGWREGQPKVKAEDSELPGCILCRDVECGVSGFGSRPQPRRMDSWYARSRKWSDGSRRRFDEGPYIPGRRQIRDGDLCVGRALPHDPPLPGSLGADL